MVHQVIYLERMHALLFDGQVYSLLDYSSTSRAHSNLYSFMNKVRCLERMWETVLPCLQRLF